MMTEQKHAGGELGTRSINAKMLENLQINLQHSIDTIAGRMHIYTKD